MRLNPGRQIWRAAAKSFVVTMSFILLIDTAKAAAITIVAIGSSNTFGWGVGQQAAFPAIIEATLRARGYDVRVINASIPLATSLGMLARLNSTVPKGTRLVILDEITADLSFGISQAQSAANFRAMVSILHARNIKTVIVDLRPLARRGFVGPDHIHLSAQGHRVAAAKLLPQVLVAIRQ